MIPPRPASGSLAVAEDACSPLASGSDNDEGDCLDLTVEQLEQWVKTGRLPVLEEWLAASPE